MQIPFLGLTVTRTKDAPRSLSPVDSRGGWWPIVRESFAGAWQQNVEIDLANVLTYSTVFACVSLIASDIAKMTLRLVQKDDGGIWNEADSPSFSPVLRKPNRYQTRIKFIEQWITSKLVHGNTYTLKQRDARGVVAAMYILDPQRVRPLVAEDGAVYYALMRDTLSNLREEQIVVPASEIIHDVMVALYHPLVGVSPIHACGLGAVMGLKIQTNSANLFANGANPSGVLTAPGAISDATAARLKAYWESNYTGDNVGKIAVLGDALKFEQMAMNAVDAQLIDQLKWTSESVCSCFHVPAWMVGVGAMPPYAQVEAATIQYYSQALQNLVENLELLLDEGLGLDKRVDGKQYGTEFDVDDLLRMDSKTAMDTVVAGVGGGIMAPNEGRRRMNLPPVPGGASPLMQAQMYSLEALAKRDAEAPPPPSPALTPAAPAAPAAEPTDATDDAAAAKFAAALFTKVAELHAA